ncbi:unnamed protein product, partial [Rotaria sp. Silwood1]
IWAVDGLTWSVANSNGRMISKSSSLFTRDNGT